MDLATPHTRINNDPAMPIRLGIPPYRWADPLCAGLDEQDQVHLIRLERHGLVEGLCTSSLECALIPPIDAIQIPGHRAIPGIGICTSEPCAPGILWADESDNPLPTGLPGFPQVHAIWVARRGAAIALLRVLLTTAFRLGEATYPQPALPLSLSYRLGSREMDAIREEAVGIYGSSHPLQTWC